MKSGRLHKMHSKLLPALLLSLQLSVCSNVMVHAFVQRSQPDWQQLHATASDSLDKNDLQTAEAAIRSALNVTGANINKKILSMELLAELLEKQDKFVEEENTLTSVIKLMRSIGYPGNFIGAAYLKVSEINFFLKRFDAAEQYAKMAIPILKESCGTFSPDVALALNNLAWAEIEEGKLSSAESHFRQSLHIASRVFGTDSDIYGMVANNIAKLYEVMNKPGSALYWYEKAASALNQSLGPHNPLSSQVAEKISKLKARSKPKRDKQSHQNYEEAKPSQQAATA